jgi:hypothetical protein
MQSFSRQMIVPIVVLALASASPALANFKSNIKNSGNGNSNSQGSNNGNNNGNNNNISSNNNNKTSTPPSSTQPTQPPPPPPPAPPIKAYHGMMVPIGTTQDPQSAAQVLLDGFNIVTSGASISPEAAAKAESFLSAAPGMVWIGWEWTVDAQPIADLQMIQEIEVFFPVEFQTPTLTPLGTVFATFVGDNLEVVFPGARGNGNINETAPLVPTPGAGLLGCIGALALRRRR